MKTMLAKFAMKHVKDLIMLKSHSISNNPKHNFAAAVEKLRIRFSLLTDNAKSSFTLDLDPKAFTQGTMISDALVKKQPYCPEFSWFLVNNLKVGDFFIDVGAHIGYYSMLAASIVGGKGKIIAFEPNTQNYQQLLEHISINSFNSIIIAENSAVSDKPGNVVFIKSKNDGGHSIVMGNAILEEHTTTKAVCLDDYFPIIVNHNAGIIKIDTEGAEYLVLKGAESFLSSARVKFLYCEHNYHGLKQQGLTMQDVIDFLKKYRYAPFVFEHNKFRPSAIDSKQPVPEDICDILFILE